MSSFIGKVAVVTGAGSGIGQALAYELGSRGARLAVSDVDAAAAERTAAQLRSAGVSVHCAQLDVSERDAMLRYADEVAEFYGVVHQLYSNAGISGLPAPVEQTDFASYERTLNVNLWGVLHGTKAFLPHVVASGAGHIITISSIDGIVGHALMSAYCTSKFAVRGFTESLRAEMAAAGHPVGVSVVHPGGIATNIVASALQQNNDLTTEQRRQAELFNSKVLRMPPAKAATIIADGVAAERSRIIVGSDARVIDLIARVSPRRYHVITGWLERRVLS